jgi:hypothetical protein
MPVEIVRPRHRPGRQFERRRLVGSSGAVSRNDETKRHAGVERADVDGKRRTAPGVPEIEREVVAAIVRDRVHTPGGIVLVRAGPPRPAALGALTQVHAVDDDARGGGLENRGAVAHHLVCQPRGRVGPDFGGDVAVGTLD